MAPEYFYREYVPPAEEPPLNEESTGGNPFQPNPSTFSQ